MCVNGDYHSPQLSTMLDHVCSQYYCTYRHLDVAVAIVCTLPYYYALTVELLGSYLHTYVGQ